MALLRPLPFRLAPTAAAAVARPGPVAPPAAADACCSPDPAPGRRRLAGLDPQLHCSVLGTCLPMDELRRRLRPVLAVDGLSDLDLHHEAVRLASQDAEVGRLLHKALDRRHAAVLQRFAGARDDAALARLWDEALQAGEVPGAYWAVLTHRQATPALRQRVFGEVHMLSHQLGASHRAELRRLAALEAEHAEARVRAERQQQRLLTLAAERDAALAELGALQGALGALQQALATLRAQVAAAEPPCGAALADAVAVQTRRRELAEGALQAARDEAARLATELQHLRGQAAVLGQELAAAEQQLRDGLAPAEGPTPVAALQGRRVLYVGGRPSSQPAIRALVQRAGGDYQRHDGGLEDRKGLLAAALAWADWVVFPVDCVDHDSALALKRACQRQGRRFAALRSAGVASFAAALQAEAGGAGAADPAGSGPCLRHG